MKTFKNKHFTKRDYECTNRVACQADANPDPKFWVECEESVLAGLDKLGGETQNGKTVWYYGYL